MELLKTDIIDNIAQITITGNYVKQDFPNDLLLDISQKQIKGIKVVFEKLDDWDSSLLALLYALSKTAKESKRSFEMKNEPSGIKKLLELSFAVSSVQNLTNSEDKGFLYNFGQTALTAYESLRRGATFALENIRNFFSSLVYPKAMRKVDVLFALQECGPKAMPIVLLISFMVGLILAFVGAVQLQVFGAEVYVASLVTIGMTRIMGAIMVGIIMAGRTGASFAATIGTMQVNEEIDALRTMGVSVNEFLVLPRMLAIVLVMPILTMFADFSGMMGGLSVGVLALDIPFGEYVKHALNAWYLKHFLVGVFHAFVFGFIIALCGCYFGINAGKNADSVGKATTNAVVYAIVWMIVATGIITLCLQRMGI